MSDKCEEWVAHVAQLFADGYVSEAKENLRVTIARERARALALEAENARMTEALGAVLPFAEDSIVLVTELGEAEDDEVAAAEEACAKARAALAKPEQP